MPLSTMKRYFVSDCTNKDDCELRLMRDPAIGKQIMHSLI